MADAAVLSVPTTPREDAMPVRRVVTFFFLWLWASTLAILDIQVVSSSLAEIQAGLSAGSDEIGWYGRRTLIAR